MARTGWTGCRGLVLVTLPLLLEGQVCDAGVAAGDTVPAVLLPSRAEEEACAIQVH